MESVALSDRQLDYLAREDPCLKPSFHGVLAANELPKRPVTRHPRAYIVNTDPADRPGHHWLAFWTHQDTCEILDTFALPLEHYQAPWIEQWVKQWKYRVQNSEPLQTIQSNSCGHYCLFYLKYKARGHSLQDFLSRFSDTDFVHNDHQVGQLLKRLITNQDVWDAICRWPCRQRCNKRA